VASASDDGTVKVWEAETGRELTSFAGADGAVSALALDPGGTEVASGGDGPSVAIRDVATVQVRLRLPLEGAGAPVSRLAYSPDGARIAVVRSAGPAAGDRREGNLTLWNAATGSRLFALNHGPAGVTDAAFSPDGLRLVSADRGGQVWVWEPATGRLLLTLRGPAGPIARIAFSTDGHRVYAAGGATDPLGYRDRETGELTFWDGRPIE
jgi:WD40 repeat protein